MTTMPRRSRAASSRRRGMPARFSPLLMLAQRSPLVKLLPEARALSTSGFAETLKWAVSAVTGLGAFDAVSGATAVTQLLPQQGSSTVAATGGQALNFVYAITGAGGHIPYSFQIVGTLPQGLVQTGLRNSNTDSVSGIPLQSGSFPITIIAWEGTGNTGRSARGSFTINVAAPPAPAVTTPPEGGNFQPGSFVSLLAGHTNGFTFTWNRDGIQLPAGNATLVSTTAARRYLVPAADPGAGWRSGEDFNDAAWREVAGGIGYDTSTTPVNYLPHLAATNGNVQSLMSGSGRPTAALIRIPFTLNGSQPLSHLKLRVQSDDGFVVWLNGTEVASQNRPATLAWNSAARADAVDGDAIVFRTINLNQHINLLRSGGNLLAIQALNSSNASSDFLFNCDLAAGIDGVNSRRLILPAVTREQAGGYTLTVTNSTASVTSPMAAVNLPPAITAQPVSQTIPFGETATLSAAAATSPPFTWQWYRGPAGDTSQPVAGATGDTFTTSALSQPEQYWVRVSNAAGSVDSNAASITLLDPFTSWRKANFAPAEATDDAISGHTADPDGDGSDNDHEYIFGTVPAVMQPQPAPAIHVEGSTVSLTFTAHKASGPGYAGRSRHYALQSTDDLEHGPWTPLPNFTDIVGDDQQVSCVLPAQGGHRYCRLHVWLSP